MFSRWQSFKCLKTNDKYVTLQFRNVMNPIYYANNVAILSFAGEVGMLKKTYRYLILSKPTKTSEVRLGPMLLFSISLLKEKEMTMVIVYLLS